MKRWVVLLCVTAVGLINIILGSVILSFGGLGNVTPPASYIWGSILILGGILVFYTWRKIFISQSRQLGRTDRC